MDDDGCQISMAFTFYGYMLKSDLTGPFTIKYKLYALLLKCVMNNSRWGRLLDGSGFWGKFKNSFYTCQVWDVYEISKWKYRIVIRKRCMDRKGKLWDQYPQGFKPVRQDVSSKKSMQIEKRRGLGTGP